MHHNGYHAVQMMKSIDTRTHTGVLQSKGMERVTLDELVAETLPHARGTCSPSRGWVGAAEG